MNWFRFLRFRREFARDLVLSTAIIVYLLASLTWLFKASPNMQVLGAAIRLLVPLILMLLFRLFVPPQKARLLLALYTILAAYTFATAFFLEKPDILVVLTAKYLYILVLFAVLVMILRPGQFSLGVVYAPVILGVLCAAQVTALFLLIQADREPPHETVRLSGYKNMAIQDYGIFGYSSGVLKAGRIKVYRGWSYFGEPTRMASFEETCAILALGLYRVRRDRKMLWALLLCGFAWLITFSITGYVVVFLVLAFFLVVRFWRRWRYMAPVLTAAAATLMVVTVLLYLKFTLGLHAGKITSVAALAVGRGWFEVQARINFVFDSLRLLRDYPFGIGFVTLEDSRILAHYPGAGGLIAPLMWAKIAGIVGVLLQTSIIGYVVFKIVVKQVAKGDSIERYLSLAFVAQVLHHCVAGDWFDSMFFLVLALVLVTEAYQLSWPSAQARVSAARLRAL